MPNGRNAAAKGSYQSDDVEYPQVVQDPLLEIKYECLARGNYSRAPPTESFTNFGSSEK